MNRGRGTPGPGVDASNACAECLRRSWLLGRLCGWIQTVVDDRDGSRTPELLRLASEELVQAVASKRVDEILSWNAGLAESQMREALKAADCWSCCRHDRNFPEGFATGPTLRSL